LHDDFLDLTEAVGMKLADPKLPEHLEFLNFSAASLELQEHEEIAVDVDDEVVNGGYKVGYLDEFVDDVDILHD
jgi:sulfur carrier protein ThiS